MFEISLGTNTSAANVVDKDFNVIQTLQGDFRAPSSIIDPVIIVQLDSRDQWRKTVNYAYVPAFRRYYYITNIIAVDGSYKDETTGVEYMLWEIHMHVDVLMSFKDQIRVQSAVVARQEFKYNLMLDDGFFMSYQNPKLQTKYFSVEGPFEHQEFVLVVAGS